jgi:hypothetical protein
VDHGADRPAKFSGCFQAPTPIGNLIPVRLLRMGPNENRDPLASGPDCFNESALFLGIDLKAIGHDRFVDRLWVEFYDLVSGGHERPRLFDGAGDRTQRAG